MMAKAKTTTDNVKDTIEDKIFEPAMKAGEAMRASGAKLAKGGSDVGMKMIEQAEANAREAFAAMRAAAAAKDLSEVMKIQGEFLRAQGTRSMSHAREVGELIMQFGREAVAPLRGKD